MCGIAGIFNLSERTVVPADLIAMTERLSHRGPDGLGYHVDGPIGLGQTRLAVIDVEGGKQPIFNEDRSVAVVFNGEIYNFQEIRNDLERAGHSFSTRSDTEVIVHLYEEMGIDCVGRLRGMFAFALWDKNQRKLFLARDFVGKKPLYYSLAGGRFLFGSEIKSLRAVGAGGALNLSALGLFFKHQFIPGSETIYQEIQSLPPAHFLVVDRNGVETKRYWEPPLPVESSMGEEAYAEVLRETLGEAVRLRLISDVPLGAFLSGGIDSSIIVGLMKKEGVEKLKTFSIGFKEESFNESPFAMEAARFFETDHRNELLEHRVADLLPKIVNHFDQPFGDSSALAVYRLSEMTRRSVTVALSGDGSDEFFAGYQRYVGRKILRYYWLLPKQIREKWIERGLDFWPEGTSYYGESMTKQLRLLIHFSRRMEENPLEVLPVTFARDELNLLCGEEAKKEWTRSEGNFVQSLADRFSDLDDVSRMMWVDFNSYLPDDILVKVDRMSMAHGLEVRSPFLDQKVIELALQMPIRLKLKHLKTKHILRKAFKDLLPPGVAERKKHGFMVPLGAWFKRELRELVHDVLFKPDREGLLNLSYIKQLFDEHQNGFRDHSQKLWLLLVFRMWEETVPL